MSLLWKVSDLLYFLGYYIIKYRKKVVRSNLQNAGLWTIKTEKAFYRHLADLVVETIKCISADKTEIEDMLSLENLDLVQHRNAIVLAGHCGNWEVANLGLKLGLINDLRSVHQPLSHTTFDALFLDFRTKWGTQMYAKKQGVRVDILDNISKPTTIVLINDQYTKSTNVFKKTFLNQETFFQKAPFDLAFEREFALIYAVVLKTGRSKYILSFKELSKEQGQEFAMNQYVSFLEKDILGHPANWLWSHKRWKMA